MSITTKRGDGGETSLLSGARVKKSCARIEALGAVDEANAFLGVARSKSRGYAEKCIRSFQEGLSKVMAELADDAATLSEEKFVGEPSVAALEEIVSRCESAVGPLKAFVVPGDTPLSADLHAARAVIRRAERRVTALTDEGIVVRPELLRYVNRLSDAVFSLARLSAEGPKNNVVPL